MSKADLIVVTELCNQSRALDMIKSVLFLLLQWCLCITSVLKTNASAQHINLQQPPPLLKNEKGREPSHSHPPNGNLYDTIIWQEKHPWMWTVMYSLHRTHIVDDVVPHVCLVCTTTNSENTDKQLQNTTCIIITDQIHYTVSVNIHLHITQ